MEASKPSREDVERGRGLRADAWEVITFEDWERKRDLEDPDRRAREKQEKEIMEGGRRGEIQIREGELSKNQAVTSGFSAPLPQRLITHLFIRHCVGSVNTTDSRTYLPSRCLQSWREDRGLGADRASQTPW